MKVGLTGNFLKRVLLVSLIGGALVALFTSMLAGFLSNPVTAVITMAVILLAMMWLAPHAKIDNESFFLLIVLLGFIGVVGSVVSIFMPATSPFILSVQSIGTVSAWILTFFYIELAEVILHKAGLM